MAKDKAGASDALAVSVAGPPVKPSAVIVGAQDFACWEKGPDGQPRQVWTAHAPNALVREGLAMLNNFVLGGQRATSNGPFMVLHNAAYNSTHGWGALSASHAADTMYSASLLPITFASTNTTATQWTATTAVQFTVNTTTVSGAALIFYTSASCSNAPANSSDVRVYNIGSFSAAQPVQNGNTLSITFSLNVTTS
jgi:hypothetical protein